MLEIILFLATLIRISNLLTESTYKFTSTGFSHCTLNTTRNWIVTPFSIVYNLIGFLMTFVLELYITLFIYKQRKRFNNSVEWCSMELTNLI